MCHNIIQNCPVKVHSKTDHAADMLLPYQHTFLLFELMQLREKQKFEISIHSGPKIRKRSGNMYKIHLS